MKRHLKLSFTVTFLLHAYIQTWNSFTIRVFDHLSVLCMVVFFLLFPLKTKNRIQIFTNASFVFPCFLFFF